MAETRQFKQDLAALSAMLRTKIEAEVSGFAVDSATTARRRKRAIRDFRYFAKTYFPHYISKRDSVLHKYLYERLLGMAQSTGSNLAVAAPRSEAKSTIVSQIFVLWCAVTARKKYIPIIMNAYDQAAEMLEMIKAELEANPRLRQDFPGQFGPGRVWREGVIVTAGNTKIHAFGSGKRMRGLRHGPNRPDLVICDDLENDENVRSRTQRDKLETWFKNAVMKLGPPDDSMDVIVIGTILHHDSLLARLIKNPMWESRRFAAIIQWPHDRVLWDRWEEILLADGEADAEMFYTQNRAAMDAGAVISWPGVRSLVGLMKTRARDGHDSFDAELQNTPLSANATFAKLGFWHEENPNWLYFGSVDPSMGKSGRRGDPSAILVGGIDQADRVLHIVEADIKRRTPDVIIHDVIELQRQYRCRLWIVETVQFQEFFKDELIRRSARVGVPVPARGVKPIGDKALRISSLQPHLANGLILLHQEQKTLLTQLRHWGEPDTHDDGPDALHMLWAGVTSGMGMIGNFQSSGRRIGMNAPGGGLNAMRGF